MVRSLCSGGGQTWIRIPALTISESVKWGFDATLLSKVVMNIKWDNLTQRKQNSSCVNLKKLQKHGNHISQHKKLLPSGLQDTDDKTRSYVKATEEANQYKRQSTAGGGVLLLLLLLLPLLQLLLSSRKAPRRLFSPFQSHGQYKACYVTGVLNTSFLVTHIKPACLVG